MAPTSKKASELSQKPAAIRKRRSVQNLKVKNPIAFAQSRKRWNDNYQGKRRAPAILKNLVKSDLVANQRDLVSNQRGKALVNLAQRLLTSTEPLEEDDVPELQEEETEEASSVSEQHDVPSEADEEAAPSSSNKEKEETDTDEVLERKDENRREEASKDSKNESTAPTPAVKLASLQNFCKLTSPCRFTEHFRAPPSPSRRNPRVMRIVAGSDTELVVELGKILENAFRNEGYCHGRNPKGIWDKLKQAEQQRGRGFPKGVYDMVNDFTRNTNSMIHKLEVQEIPEKQEMDGAFAALMEFMDPDLSVEVCDSAGVVVTTLRSENRRLHRENTILSHSNRRLQDENTRQQDQLRDLSHSNRRLQDELYDLSHEYESAGQAIARRDQVIAQQADEIAQLRARVQQLQHGDRNASQQSYGRDGNRATRGYRDDRASGHGSPNGYYEYPYPDDRRFGNGRYGGTQY